MQFFIDYILNPRFILTFAVLLLCLSSGFPTYVSRVRRFWVLWFLAIVTAFIVYIKLAFGV